MTSFLFRHLPLKLLNVAEACNYCQAYFLSVIYLELWALGEQEKTVDEQLSNDKIKAEIMSNSQFQKIARKVNP